jgi:hypothetical protein
MPAINNNAITQRMGKYNSVFGIRNIFLDRLHTAVIQERI